MQKCQDCGDWAALLQPVLCLHCWYRRRLSLMLTFPRHLALDSSPLRQ